MSDLERKMFGDPDNILAEIRDVSNQIRECVNSQHPKALLRSLWAHLATKTVVDEVLKIRYESNTEPDKIAIILALEMLHATLAGDGVITKEFKNIDNDTAMKLIRCSEKLFSLCMQYIFATSEVKGREFVGVDQSLEFPVHSSWLLRGKRYPALEKEYFEYVLKPHAVTLREIYDIDEKVIAKEIQKFSNNIHTFGIHMDRVLEITKRYLYCMDIHEDEYLAGESSWTRSYLTELHNIIQDSLCDDVFCLSRQTRLPEKFLSDLACVPGENESFFDSSKFSGTPLQGMPSRIRPLIELDGEYYCTEPFSIRDSLYRVVKFSVDRQKPEKKEEWNKSQKAMSEAAFGEYLPDKYNNANIQLEVYYEEQEIGWTEIDCIVSIDDVLICVEAKAGNSALSSPVRNLEEHLSGVQRLIMKSFKQTNRFVRYIESNKISSIYKKPGSKMNNVVGRIDYCKLRKIIPIGLTLETFTPHSTGMKDYYDLTVGEDKHQYICMSVDDLLVLSKVFNTLGQFVHYLEFRQEVGRMDGPSVQDELCYACKYINGDWKGGSIGEGSYGGKLEMIKHREMEKSVLDEYFEDPNYSSKNAPQQSIPSRVADILELLESTGEDGWLSMNAFIRNMSDDEMQELNGKIAIAMKATMKYNAVVFDATCGEERRIFSVVKKDSMFTKERTMYGFEAIAKAYHISGEYVALRMTRKTIICIENVVFGSRVDGKKSFTEIEEELRKKYRVLVVR